MESVHFRNSSENQGSQESFGLNSDNYQFPLDLADIPCPDDDYMETEHSAQSAGDVYDIELPLPPGSTDIELPSSSKFKNVSSPLPSFHESPASSKDDFSLPINTERIPLPESDANVFNILPLPSEDEHPENNDDLVKSTSVDDSKYSPSKVESDDENQDSIAIKPKVLGKEQAKKRLLAFSLSKQPNTTVKKQNKVLTPAKSKEKPPNPNKSSGVQEQFRATISAIEEEKRKMMQNMPNYLLLEMSELSKSTQPIISSLKIDKQKTENENSHNNSSKDDGGLNISVDGGKSMESSSRSTGKSRSNRSRSRSKRRKRSRSRSRRRSRSRSQKRSRRRSHSRSKSKTRRSHSRSRRSRSNTRKARTEKKSDRKESSSFQKKDLFEDWKSFKVAGLIVEEDSNQTKKLHSPSDQSDFRPIFNYLKKGNKIMANLEARPANSNHYGPVVFAEKTVKYTRTKPIISWAENPSHATEFYMSKQMLLENVDQETSSILHFIIDAKSKVQSDDDFLEVPPIRTRSWYPQEDYLLPILSSLYESEELSSYKKSEMDKENKKDTSSDEDKHKAENSEEVSSDEKRKRKPSRERKVSLVNDSYMSDEEAKVKEMMVGGVKVQLDLDMNSVKVRSKWDSDYEGETSEKEAISRKESDVELRKTPVEKRTEKPSSSSNAKFQENTKPEPSKTDDPSAKKKIESPTVSSSNHPQTEAIISETPSDAPTGNLVSEYEEFLKMVSFDSSDVNPKPTEEVIPKTISSDSKLDKQKTKTVEKPVEEEPRKSSKIGTTDWDQESDEEKSSLRKISFGKGDPHDEFLLLKNEKVDLKKKKSKKNVLKKKTEKLKPKKKKILKKSGKGKKSKYEDSSSEDSSSDSYESSSSSDSDSDESRSSKRKKKKKISKAKKKSKKESSSDSESDSDDSKSKKKKQKKKKGGKKKKKVSSDSEEEIQNVLLKQLDFKKQLIMNKIEEIDSISERSGKKKIKEVKLKKKEKESSEEAEVLDKHKSKKKRKLEDKSEKNKKKSKPSGKKNVSQRKSSKESSQSKSSSESDSESESESSGDTIKKKKSKKETRRKRDSSESSDSEQDTRKGGKSQGKHKADLKNSKSSGKTSKSNKKTKKGKKKEEDSSESESDDDSGKDRKKSKKEKKMKNDEKENLNRDEGSRSNWKDNLLLEEPDERRLEWGGRKVWKKSEVKTKKKKDEDDWEASSSLEDSSQECKTRESSWDDEGGSKLELPKVSVPKNDSLGLNDSKTNGVSTDKKTIELKISETTSQPISETLKTSLSNFSFNENSFCSFGQELSRDFFLTERCLTNSMEGGGGENLKPVSVDPRPFQSVSKDCEIKKPTDSELYSPGYSDSEVSDVEVNKPEKVTYSNSESVTKEDVYDPLNCDSEGSVENSGEEVSTIPLPFASDILLPGEKRNFQSVGAVAPQNVDNNSVKGFVPIEPEMDKSDDNLPSIVPPLKSSFTCSDFTPVMTVQSPFKEDKGTPTKKQVISVKGPQKLQSKAASVFQDESDEEEGESAEKSKTVEPPQNEISECLKENRNREVEKNVSVEVKEKEKSKKRKKEKENRERSVERDGKRRRSSSRERRDSSKYTSRKTSSPSQRKRSRTPEPNKSKEKREIRSDSFEIEPLKVSNVSNDLTESVQPIPVLTGFGVSSSDRIWRGSHLPGYTCNEFSNNLIDHAESFDIYPSEDSRLQNRSYEKDLTERDDKKSAEKSSSDKSSQRDERSKKESRKSHSRSLSPRKRRRSKSPERRKSPRSRSPRRRSTSPKRREKSPFSPRRRSPKRKSPSRRSRSSRSPDRRRKSRSRSPRKRRSSPSRRSRSLSPRRYRSPKRRGSFSPKEGFSPRRSAHFPQPYPTTFHNRIPVIGVAGEEMSSSAVLSPRFEGSMGFPRHHPDAALGESDVANSFYNREYTDEFGATNYPEEITVNNLITVKNHDMEKPNSPERLSLDQRIELELGVQLKSGSQDQNAQYQFQDMNPNHFQNSYNCENTSANTDNFYQNPDFNGQYFNGHQQQPPPSYGPFQQYPPPQPVQSSVLQVGNIVEVVPTHQHPPPPPPPIPSKPHQIMQVGNVLQVVPTPKAVQASPVPPPASHNYGTSVPPTAPLVKTQKATAVVAPSSIVPTPNPEALINPLVKAIQLEREKRRKEKEKRKAEREARRKARQLRREAKLMSVNEKLKKSVQDEGLMLGQEVEDDELLDGLDVPSPPIPVEIITVSSQNTLPPAGKGILITAGFMPKPPSEKKEVKFADGVCPGEGTSTSGDEDIASPPPKPKLPKEKRYKKKKTKVKKKVKVQIIRQIIQDEDDDDDDDLSPPPPPPGDPPPVFFARFPFAGDAQFPVYQTQTTTTTTLTTVQYPAQPFQ